MNNISGAGVPTDTLFILSSSSWGPILKDRRHICNEENPGGDFLLTKRRETFIAFNKEVIMNGTALSAIIAIIIIGIIRPEDPGA